MGLSEKAAAHRERYLAAAHAMQSGVALKIGRDPNESSRKHLRVGVNMAMVEHGALVDLLVRKSLINDEEYFAAVADAMEEEVASYRRDLNLPPNVTLR